MFGCTAYIHVPKDERGKLDLKTRKCILLGYGSVQKGYRVFYHLTQKVLHSRNVKFEERESGIPQFKSEKSVQQPLILYQMDETEYNDGQNVEGNGTSEESSTLETQQVPPRRSTREW